MTSRDLYEGVLIELNKENAPNILLEEFNYFANKAINQYINKRYNIYDVNQQTTDDLRVLKSNAMLTPTRISGYDSMTLADNGMATYYVDLPADYLHLLNCIVIYNVLKTYKCYNKGDTWRAAATRLTADAYSQVLDNFWLKPTYKRPYYYIHNVNTSTELPTNPIELREYIEYRLPKDIETIEKEDNTTTKTTITYRDLNTDTGKCSKTILISTKTDELLLWLVELLETEEVDAERVIIKKLISGTDSSDFNNIDRTDIDGNRNLIVLGTGLPKSIIIGGELVSNVERGQALRYGNVSKVRMEIRYGTDTSVFTLDGGKIYIDYIKSPQHIRLTQKELDTTEDNSLMLEFPDYVCQEILNELVHLIMENISDLRLQTHPVVSLSIANPAQALAPQAALGLAAQQ